MVDIDVGAHTGQFRDMHEAVSKIVSVTIAALSDRHQDHVRL